MDMESGEYTRNRRRRAWIGLLLLCCLATSLSAQTLRQHLWNFDNRIQPGRFNTLRVLIQNNGSEPLDADLRVYRSAAGLRRGAPILARCYLSPRTSRWITLRPFFAGAGDSWVLDWPDLNVLASDLPHAGEGPRAIVYLKRESEMMDAQTPFPPFRAFAAKAWPVDQLSLLSLRAVVVDHPLSDLSTRQRESLLRWVRCGGRVHVIQRDETWPVFDTGLEELNPAENLAVDRPGAPLRQGFALGGGRVILHRTDGKALRKELPADFEEEHIPLQLGANVFRSVPGRLHSQVRATARASVDPDRSWGLIILFTLVYTVLVGPGFWWFSRRAIPWWTALLSLAGLVTAAALLFEVLGARSNEELDQRRSLLTLNYLGEGQWAATEFSGVFSTEQRNGLTLRSRGQQASFNSAQVNEAIAGEIRMSAKPTYTLDMPANSHRFIAHQSVVTGPKIEVRVRGSRAGTSLSFSSDPGFRELYGICGDEWLVFEKRAGVWAVRHSEALTKHFSDDDALFGTVQETDGVNPRRAISYLAYDQAELLHRRTDFRSMRRDKLQPGDRQLLLFGIGPALAPALYDGFVPPIALSSAIYVFQTHRP